jgi:hypothetical protein
MNEKLAVTQSGSANQKPYTAPALITFGHFRDLTLANSNTGTKADGTSGASTKLNTGA